MKHRLERRLDGLKIPTITIPIKFIKQAQGKGRPRTLNEQHAASLAEMMWWSPNAGAGSPALVCVEAVDGDETTTDRDKFDWEKVIDGKYKFICFGHQHLLHGKNLCVERDAKEHPDESEQRENFKLMDCRLYIGLSPEEMVLVRTYFLHPSV